MAWSVADVPAADRASLASDKPLAITTNAVGPFSAVTPFQWSIVGGSFADADVSDPDFSTRRLCDGYGYLPSKPNASLSGMFRAWAMLRLDTSKPFDCAVILGHNFGALCAAGVLVTLEIADNDTFGTNLTKLYQWGDVGAYVTTNRRLTSYSLIPIGGGSAAQAISGAAYARIKVQTSDSTDFLVLPSIGEIILGRRRQLRRGGQHPNNYGSLKSASFDFVPKGGARTRYPAAKGQAYFNHRFTPAASAEISVFDSIFSDCDYGQKPLVWVEKPTTEPSKALHGFGDSVKEKPLVDAYEVEYRINFEESSPFYETEV
jgi:hypothetical protein